MHGEAHTRYVREVALLIGQLRGTFLQHRHNLLTRSLHLDDIILERQCVEHITIRNHPGLDTVAQSATIGQTYLSLHCPTISIRYEVAKIRLTAAHQSLTAGIIDGQFEVRLAQAS